MNSAFYDLAGQVVRREAVYAELIRYTRDRFDVEGQWLGAYGGETPAPLLRERLWFCLPFLAVADRKLWAAADAIIQHSEYAFCTFAPLAALQILLRYRERLAPASLMCLENYVAGVLDAFAGADMDFVGVNDNFPCMATFTVLAGGKLCGRPELVDLGRRRLGQLTALLERRGVPTEYNSPTYSPIQLLALAEIAEWSDDAALREQALKCEERIWLDVLGHYHPPTAQAAGPYSRAYMVDSCGHTHMARSALYALLGEEMAVHPLNTLFTSAAAEPGEVIHLGVPYMQVAAAWLAVPTYHCPEGMVHRLLQRPYPFTFRATTEFSSSTDASPDKHQPELATQQELYEYPAGNGTISTYMTEDYALGVASHEFHGGVQTDSFHLLYRRQAPVRTQADIATVFARYVINDRRPGQGNRYPQIAPDGAEQLVPTEAEAVSAEGQAHHGRLCSDCLLWDEGRKLGLHHERSALLLYKPKLYGRRSVTSLRLALLFPAQYGVVEEIWLGDRRINAFPAESRVACPIFIKDGPVLMGFQPLLLTNHGRKAAVRVEQVNGYLAVSFINYEGSRRDFSRREFLLTGNGFYAEVQSTVGEPATWEKFRREFSRLEVRDEMFACEHSRQTFLRRTMVNRPGLCLVSEYSPVSEGIKYQAINGRPPPAPRLELTGIDEPAVMRSPQRPKRV